MLTFYGGLSRKACLKVQPGLSAHRLSWFPAEHGVLENFSPVTVTEGKAQTVRKIVSVSSMLVHRHTPMPMKQMMRQGGAETQHFCDPMQTHRAVVQ